MNYVGTGALLLQTLYDESFVSDDDDDDNVVLPSMSDACKNMLPPYDIFSVTEKLKNIFDKKIITEIEDQTKGQDENQDGMNKELVKLLHHIFHQFYILDLPKMKRTIFQN